MRVVIDYFETGTKEVKQMTGKLFFGDALLSDSSECRLAKTNGNIFSSLKPLLLELKQTILMRNFTWLILTVSSVLKKLR